MNVLVHNYAALKDYFEAQMEVVLTPGGCVADLVATLVEKNPASEKLLQICRVAVNENIIGRDYRLSDHDKIYILPPSSGG
ncbi:MAG: MoaD/ThiS family protein [Leptospirales bacterium]